MFLNVGGHRNKSDGRTPHLKDEVCRLEPSFDFWSASFCLFLMKLKRNWTLGIIFTVVVFILADCNGDNTPTSWPLSQVDPVFPTVAAQLSTSPLIDAPEVTDGGNSHELATCPRDRPGSSDDSSRFIWEISAEDGNGAKPSLTVNSDGVPHIVVMLEAAPGFVKHAVLDDAAWGTTIAEGYLYGPLDIELVRVATPDKLVA